MNEKKFLTAQESRVLAKGYRTFDELISKIKVEALGGYFFCKVYLLSDTEIAQLENLGYKIQIIINSKGDSGNTPAYNIRW